MVNEQVENGENPYGKRKRRYDAGKARKKRRQLTVDHGSSYPPSDSDEDTPMDNVRPELGLEQPRKVIHKCALNALKGAQCSSSMPTTATASSSSSAHGIGIVATTPSTGVGATTTAHSKESTRLPKVLPAHRLVNSSNDSESGEEEFKSEDDDEVDDD